MAYTHFGTSTDNFTRTINSTTARFFKDEEKNILMRRRLTAALQSAGRVSLNEYGDELKWPVRYKRSKPVVLGDVVSLNFPRVVKDKVGVMPWIGLAVTDSIGEKEKLLNKGPAAIIRQVSAIMSRLKEDIGDQFGLELYQNGVTSPGHLHGVETMMGTALASKNNKVAIPDGSFAGHPTQPGLLGTWTGAWPDGSGDAEYDWWSPIILLAKGTGWGSSPTWQTNAKEILRYGIFTMARTTKDLDLILLTRQAYTD